MSDEEEKDFMEELEEELSGLEKMAEDVGPPPTTVLAETAPKPPQMITFDRYFMSLGRPMHHKAGMEAYGKTKGKKTREAWEALFAKY